MSQVSQENPCENITQNSVTGKSQAMIILWRVEIYHINDITKIIHLTPLIRMWQH